MPKKDEDVQWLDAFVLYIKNRGWAQNVYDAIWKLPSSFRLIADNKVLVRVPKTDTVQHDHTHTVLWSTKDVEWDDKGCLVVKDHKLGKSVVTAHDNGLFDIAIPDPAGPIGENKINAMCPC